MEKIEVSFKTNFYSKKRIIEFSDESLCLYENNILLKKIYKDEMKDIRYGIKWIKGSDFIIGRVYCIFIRDSNNKVLKIKLRSLYRINGKILYTKYNNLLDKLYEFYISEKIANYIAEINNGTDIEIANIVFKKDGVQLDINKSDGFVKWEDMDSRVYTYYYTLISKKKPDFYKAFTYLTDWNAVLVYSISRQILVNKGLYIE